MKKALIGVIFFFGYRFATAQQFGGNPPYIKWRQVNNEAARVIYPEGLDSIAQRVAATVQQLEPPTRLTIGPKRRTVNIVLQNQTTVSNAYVALAPFRSEFNLTAPQNSFSLGSLPWYFQLATHEFRHVQQNNNFNVGLSKVLRTIFGEGGQALANSLVVPDWFYEGDAVYNETNVSRQGRGRLPTFFNGYRSLWEAGKNYSWMKLRNGSLRDYVPDHYRLGYMLVAYGRQTYGDEVWKKITRDAAAYNGLTYPFQKAVRKYTGVGYTKFREDALSFFRDQTMAGKTGDDAKTSGEHFRANEESPAYVNDSTLVYIKTTYKNIPAFIIRSGNTEKVLRIRNVSLDDYFSYRNGNIIYASYRPDIRWGWKDYSDLQLIDVSTGRQRTVTNRTKYFSPDISEDGTRIIAVKVTPNGNSQLDLLDAAKGSVISFVPNTGHFFYTYPVFYGDKHVVSALRNGTGQMALARIDLQTGSADYFTPFSDNVIGYPFIQHDTVYFSAAHGSADRIFGYVINSKQLFLLKHPALEGSTGVYRPVASSGTLAWSRFTASGYVVNEAQKAAIGWESMSGEQFAGALPEFGIKVLDHNPIKKFDSSQHLIATRYSKSFRLINFHSVYPLVDDPLYALSFISENVLNTLQSSVFFRYNRNEQYKQLGAEAVYGGWFPNISVGGSYTFDRRGLYRGKRIYWNESDIRAGISVPLNLSKGRNYTSLNIGSDVVYNQSSFRGVYKDSIGNRAFGYLNNYMVFTNQVQQARQHIYPRFAQTVTLNYKKSVSNLDANQLLLSGSLYLPGFSTNHSLVLQAAFQQRDTLNQHSYTNAFPFSRGYTAESFYKMVKWGVNYHLQLWYPDAGFGGIVYFLRVRANAFYDQTLVTDARLKQAYFRSSGTEVFFDTRWWNQLPLSIGVRYSYLLDKDRFGGSGNSRFELVLPVNLLQQ